MLGRVAVVVTRTPGRVATVAAVLAACVLAGVVPLAGGLSTGSFENSGWESVKARVYVEDATGVRLDSAVVALVEPGGSGRPLAARMREVRRTLARDPAVAATRTIEPRGRDRNYVVAQFGRVSDDRLHNAVARLRDRFANVPGVVLGGPAVADAQLNETVRTDLARAELLAFPVLLLILFLVFRGVIPALLPLGLGLLTISGSALALGAINEVAPLSVFALNLVAGLGLGLSVDYSLLMVVRYREEAAALGFGTHAVARTVRTAGQTIAFSAVTVAAAMAALLVFPLQFLYSMGIAGILVASFSALLTICVLPAVLLLLGERVGEPREIDCERAEGFWFRRAQAAMRRPVLTALVVMALLLALGLPVLGARYTVSDASSLPGGTSAREVAGALARDLPKGALSPAHVVVSAPRTSRPAVRRLAAAITRRTGVTPTRPRYLARSVWTLDVPTRGAPSSARAQRIVDQARSAPSALSFVVGGETALFVDLKGSIGASLPAAIAILALATVVALFLLTGSVLLPLKAVVMNVLSISASVGLLVLLFQHGVLGGGDGQAGLEVYQPVLLAALAFGLSTDYAVFLLARIKGFHERGDSNVEAVSYGLQRTGRLVTAAALLFCVAIGALVTSSLSFVQQLGIGAAAAVLIDATVIRCALVPALMALLGRWNWWAPRPMRAVYARVEGSVREEGTT